LGKTRVGTRTWQNKGRNRAEKQGDGLVVRETQPSSPMKNGGRLAKQKLTPEFAWASNAKRGREGRRVEVKRRWDIWKGYWDGCAGSLES